MMNIVQNYEFVQSNLDFIFINGNEHKQLIEKKSLPPPEFVQPCEQDMTIPDEIYICIMLICSIVEIHHIRKKLNIKSILACCQDVTSSIKLFRGQIDGVSNIVWFQKVANRKGVSNWCYLSQ